MNFFELQNTIDKNKPIEFGDIFDKSIELFKKSWQQGLIFILIAIAIMVPVFLLMFLPLTFAGFIDATVFHEPNAGILSMMTMFIIFIPAMFLISAIFMLLNAGFFRILKEIDMGGAVDTASFTMFFKAHYIKKAFVLSLATTFIAVITTMACVLPVIYVSIPLKFVAIIFAFNPELSPTEILKSCFNLGNKKWLIAFGLTFVAGLLAETVGMLLCGIGIFVTASFVQLPIYFIYKEVVGFNSGDEIDELGQDQFSTDYTN